MRPVKLGVVGCGAISSAYFSAMKKVDVLQVMACADLDPARAKSRAAQFDIPRACAVEELLADPEIEIVLNLTVPRAHAEVNLAAIEAGKSVYVEKPLAVLREDGKRTLDAARAREVRLGAAPDTFLGASHQTCRKLIDDGWIGEPVACAAFMQCRGHEHWHASPEFYYERGGGPMFDMGPYYITALLNLLGPVRRVTGSARITFPERTITSRPKYGKTIHVETPTHIAGVMDFACGAVGTIVTSFDVWEHTLPHIEVYGSEGTLSVPDPNESGGAVKVLCHKPVTVSVPGLEPRRASNGWVEIAHTHRDCTSERGIGVADMAYGLRTGRDHRANGELAYHVLDVMQSFLDASTENAHIQIQSRCERPAALPTDLEPGKLD